MRPSGVSANKNMAPVTIITSWDKKKYTVKADAEGKWKTYGTYTESWWPL
jgi:hypothetical protein